MGAKLKPEWIAEVLLRGKRQREYLDASMPQFGEANVGHLLHLFPNVDKLEAVPIPKTDTNTMRPITINFSMEKIHNINYTPWEP